MRKSIVTALLVAGASQALGPIACSNSSSSGTAAGGGGSDLGGSSNVGGSTAASTTTGVCASSCLKDCGSDRDCNQSAGEMCCDYGPDGKACVAATQCPRYCSDDSKCNVPSGEACMMTVEASAQLVCTKPANALRTCSGNTDCSTNETCCTIYKTPVCLATNLCPAACSSSSECNGAANEVCCTSLPTIDKTLAVNGLCVDTSKVACPKLCGTSTDCNTSAGEICCDGRCSTTCTKSCTSNSDCPGQICCKTRAQNSPFRTTQKLGYAANTGGSGSGGTTSMGGTKATGGTAPTGGTKATGGTAGTLVTGGTRATGGTTGTSITGGTRATGGTAGASATGGNATGGTTGALSSGGTVSSGGASSSGGTLPSGGASSGGTSSTGGTSPAGGTLSTGGTDTSIGTTAASSGGASSGGTSATGGTTGYCASLMPSTASGNLNIAMGIVSVGTLQGQAYTATVNGSNTTSCITPKCDNTGVCEPPWGQTALCAAGVVTADSISGAMAIFGFNLNQSGGTLGTITAPPNITVSVVSGTSAGDVAARIALVDNSGKSYCVQAGQWSSGSAIPIGRFTTNCWDTTGTALTTGVQLVSIEVEIPSSVTTDRPFDICLTDVKTN